MKDWPLIKWHGNRTQTLHSFSNFRRELAHGSVKGGRHRLSTGHGHRNGRPIAFVAWPREGGVGRAQSARSKS